MHGRLDLQPEIIFCGSMQNCLERVIFSRDAGIAVQGNGVGHWDGNDQKPARNLQELENGALEGLDTITGLLHGSNRNESREIALFPFGREDNSGSNECSLVIIRISYEAILRIGHTG
jgi:hypothetical protein